MQLTTVIDYFNVRLPALHPHAGLCQGASYRLQRGLLCARVADFILRPHLTPVRTATGAVFGQRARLLVRSAAGRPLPPESVHCQAWDADNIAFLDHFLRTFQALNYVYQGHAGTPLVLDLHLRHLAAARADHPSRAFEALLNLRGLGPGQIVLRLDGATLHGDADLQGAARRFAGRGYRLLATRAALGHTDWNLLRALGVRWVTPHPRDLEAWQDHRIPGQAHRRHAPDHIGLWLDEVDTPAALARARTLGADLIEYLCVAQPVPWSNMWLARKPAYTQAAPQGATP